MVQLWSWANVHASDQRAILVAGTCGQHSSRMRLAAQSDTHVPACKICQRVCAASRVAAVKEVVHGRQIAQRNVAQSRGGLDMPASLTKGDAEEKKVSLNVGTQQVQSLPPVGGSQGHPLDCGGEHGCLAWIRSEHPNQIADVCLAAHGQSFPHNASK